MIEMKHINLSFKDKLIFSNQEIKIASGNITLITGESGSGKSTLLFELARLTNYASKEYYYKNEKVISFNEERFRKKIGFVFQDCRLFDDLTVIQNITFFSQTAGIEFDKEKMLILFDELDLNIDLNGSVKVLSGGQKQRLLILCCMMKDPEMIFLDEPTAYLDDENRKRMRKIITDLCYKYHKTIIIASHDLDMLEIANIHYHIENKKIILKNKDINNFQSIKRTIVKTNPIAYYLHAYRSNKVHYKRNIIISFLMIIVTYMVSFQVYYQNETERMINKAIDNELRISYNAGSNAYDVVGKPVSKALIQDLLSNNMVTSVSPFFEWNVILDNSSFKENVVIQPYNSNFKLYKSDNNHELLINDKKLNNDKIYLSYSLYQKINDIDLKGKIQVIKNNDYSFVELPFMIIKADVIDKEILNRYTRTSENIIYISQNLYQKIMNQYIKDATYQSNVYLLKIDSYKNTEAVIDYIKTRDQDINIYNPVSSLILNKTTSLGFEMINKFSKIIFTLFILSCFIIGIFDIVSKRYQYALLLINGMTKLDCLKIIIKARLNYCLLSIIIGLNLVILLFYLQYQLVPKLIIEKVIIILLIINMIIIIVPNLTFFMMFRINNAGNILKTSEV